jgi:aminomethyltransferase
MLKTTPFHARTAPLVRAQTWRRWAGHQVASAYDPHPDREYAAVRNAAALFDVSPLYKYLIRGRDAARLLDRMVTRDVTKCAVGQVLYTPWCDANGKVIDDGTVSRLDESTYRLTSAEPNVRWLAMNAVGMDVTIEEVSARTAALALQGPLSRAILQQLTPADLGKLKYFRLVQTTVRDIPVTVSRTGYTGDLGYELWIPAERAAEAWDVVMTAGRANGIRPAGMLALDVVRLEAGLVLLEVDYTSARHALNPEQNYSPFELGMGKLVNLDAGDFVGRLALRREQELGGPPRRLVGVQLEWAGIEQSFTRQGLAPAISAAIDRSAVPVFARGGDRQIGKVTSHGWSPILKQAIGLASVPPAYEAVGTPLAVEWTVEGHRGRVDAAVVPLPFLDLPRKRS